MTRATDCRPGKTHRFNPVSGWCDHACGNRNDGRVVSRGGGVIYPGPYERPQQQPAQLDGFSEYRERLDQ